MNTYKITFRYAGGQVETRTFNANSAAYATQLMHREFLGISILHVEIV